MTSARVAGKAPVLPEFDVRLETDEAVRRGWAEIGRRGMRLAAFLALDVAATAVAAYLAGALFPDSPVVQQAGTGGWWLVAFLLIVQPLTLGVFGAYGAGENVLQASRVLKGVLGAVLLAWLYAQVPGGPIPGFGALEAIVYTVLAAALILLGRWALRRTVVFAYDRGIGQRRVLVVGTAEDVSRVVESLALRQSESVRIMGRLSATSQRDDGAMGTVTEIQEAIRSTGSRNVIVSSDLSYEAFETFVRHCLESGATVSVVPRHLHRFSSRLELRRTPGGVLLDVHPQGLRLPHFAIKRLIDVTVCGVALALGWPLMALIALAIKLDSPGPVLFKQQRCGLGGRPFYMYKFRTMVADADRMKKQLQHLNESGDPRLFKIKRDPRITRIGRILRRTSLDELPQLFNVLKGDMSLVGPRPFFMEDLETYEPHHFERLSVLPGITGLWQVSGRSDIVDFEEVVRLDRAYIRNWSITRDFWILLRTLPAAFGRGAY